MDIGLQEPTEPIRPRLGYVALLDVLGFKGVWQQHKDMTLVLEKMRRVANAGKFQESLYNRDLLKVAGGKPTCTVSFFSDTIVISAKFASDTKMRGQAPPQKRRSSSDSAHYEEICCNATS